MPLVSSVLNLGSIYLIHYDNHPTAYLDSFYCTAHYISIKITLALRTHGGSRGLCQYVSKLEHKRAKQK